MVEAREAVNLGVVMAAEVAGAGQSTPATTRATAVSREQRGEEEEEGFGRSDRTGPGRVDPVGPAPGTCL